MARQVLGRLTCSFLSSLGEGRMAKKSVTRYDRFPPQLALPPIVVLSLTSWAQVIGIVWGVWTITSAIWAVVKLALPIAVDVAQLH